MKIDVPYGITRRLSNSSIGIARERITAALQIEGFGILTEIDVQKTLETKLGVKMGGYLILGGWPASSRPSSRSPTTPKHGSAAPSRTPKAVLNAAYTA